MCDAHLGDVVNMVHYDHTLISQSQTDFHHDNITSDCWMINMITLFLLISVLSPPVVISEIEMVSECSLDHVREAIENSEECRPRPTIVTLPWPGNINIQQVIH